jgi:protein SCO1
MRLRDQIFTVAAGLTGFAVAILCVFYAASFSGARHQAREAPIGGPFALVDDTGATVTEKTLAGKPSAIYFGYTFCPDVCPTTLLDLSRWIKKLGPLAEKLNYVFVSIDPERDTPTLMQFAASPARPSRLPRSPRNIASTTRSFRRTTAVTRWTIPPSSIC